MHAAARVCFLRSGSKPGRYLGEGRVVTSTVATPRLVQYASVGAKPVFVCYLCLCESSKSNSNEGWGGGA